jgi:hypothetical protein
MNAELIRTYQASGFRFFPCVGKKPSVRGWQQVATTEATCIAEAIQIAGKTPERNIGMVVPRGCVVLDVDTMEALSALKDLEPADGPVLGEDCPVQTTGRGGLHIVYALPEGKEWEQLGNKSGGLPKGIDIRSGGKGYIIVAPSVHPETDKQYEWQTPLAPLDSLPDLPSWIQELLKPNSQRSANSIPAYRSEGDAEDTMVLQFNEEVKIACEQITSASKGLRNTTLNKQVYTLAGISSAYSICKPIWYQAMDEVQNAARKTGLSNYEIQQTIESAATAGLKHPLAPHLQHSDLGNAFRFKINFGANFRYVPSAGWMHWNGQKWELDEEGLLAREHMSRIGKILREEASNTIDPKKAKSIFHFACRSESANAVASALRLAQPLLSLKLDAFDSCPLLLN